jgi:hypothetical protein
MVTDCTTVPRSKQCCGFTHDPHLHSRPCSWACTDSASAASASYKLAMGEDTGMNMVTPSASAMPAQQQQQQQRAEHEARSRTRQQSYAFLHAIKTTRCCDARGCTCPGRLMLANHLAGATSNLNFTKFCCMCTQDTACVTNQNCKCAAHAHTLAWGHSWSRQNHCHCPRLERLL